MAKSTVKYYVVWKGKVPGIYADWETCKAQIDNFSGAAYKSFTSLQAAQSAYGVAGAQVNAPKTPEPAPALVEPHLPYLEQDYVVLYSDGGAINNPGPGGYGTVLLWREHRKELSQGFRLTTNNRMELLGCITGLEAIKRPSAKVMVYTDSKYVVDGIEKGWAKRWRANHWMRDAKHQASNHDLWQRLLALTEQHQVTLNWVKGHAGMPLNERCDELATQAARADTQLQLIDDFFEKQVQKE